MSDNELSPDEREWAALEGAAEADVRAYAALLAEAAAPIWHWGDGEGGAVRRLLEEAFDAAGLRRLPYRPSPGRNRSAIPPNTRAQVYARDGLKCVRCGSTQRLTVDHIIPHSKGGADTIDNLQTLCGPCNSSKGDR